jgi:NADPH-dependent 7-cyano-7-deazaguanine reductase QueF
MKHVSGGTVLRFRHISFLEVKKIDLRTYCGVFSEFFFFCNLILSIVKMKHTSWCLFNNQPDALIIQIYSVIKLYMFWASSLPIIRSFLLYIRH